MPLPVFTKNTLNTMNTTSLWKNTINHPDKNMNDLDDDIVYELYPSGDCSLDGRVYIPIKKGTKITKELKQKLNLL